MAKSTKILAVRLRWWRRRTFRQSAGEWSSLVFEDGRLVILKPDGTKVVYAPGRWVSYETRLVGDE